MRYNTQPSTLEYLMAETDRQLRMLDTASYAAKTDFELGALGDLMADLQTYRQKLGTILRDITWELAQ